MRSPLRSVGRFAGRRLSYANVTATVALFLALGTGTAYAANTVFSTDIVDGQVLTQDIGDAAVTSTQVKDAAIRGVDVATNTLTTADIAGADLKTGHISLSGVPNGRCLQVNLSVPGTKVTEFPMVTPLAAIQDGIVLHAQRVSVAGTVVMDACNFSGGAMTAISNLPVRVITYG
jgi:hypothetical protein